MRQVENLQLVRSLPGQILLHLWAESVKWLGMAGLLGMPRS